MTKAELTIVKNLLLKIKPQDEQVAKALALVEKDLAAYAARRGQLRELADRDYELSL